MWPVTVSVAAVSSQCLTSLYLWVLLKKKSSNLLISLDITLPFYCEVGRFVCLFMENVKISMESDSGRRRLG